MGPSVPYLPKAAYSFAVLRKEASGRKPSQASLVLLQVGSGGQQKGLRAPAPWDDGNIGDTFSAHPPVPADSRCMPQGQQGDPCRGCGYNQPLALSPGSGIVVTESPHVTEPAARNVVPAPLNAAVTAFRGVR